MKTSQSMAEELIKNLTKVRVIFCAYWLYFFGIRGIFDGVRLLDYLGMSLVILGLTSLIRRRFLNWPLVGWVTVFMCPLFIAATLDPSAYIILFLLKSFLVAIYFTGYLKSVRLTISELVCFAIPVVVSVYFFLYPRPTDEVHLLTGRMTGIDEPNFTSLSLIYALCGSYGIYVLASSRRVKVGAILIAGICLLGVALTASRAGAIGATIAFCCFLVIEKRKTLIIVFASLMTVLSFSNTFLSGLVIIQRFQDTFFPGAMAINNLYGGRDLLVELAWNSINNSSWFIGGGPQRLSEWGSYVSFAVPHNSFLDMGIEFGKASFYFYSGMFICLLATNVRAMVRNWQCRNHEEKTAMLAAMLFLSLMPMYMSLSTGMAMTFILWMVLGAYPLLHATQKQLNTTRTAVSLR